MSAYRDIPGVILIYLLHKVVPKVLTGIFECLRKGRAQLLISILKRLAHFDEGLDILVSSKLEAINSIIFDGFLYDALVASEDLLELVSARYELIIPSTVTSKERVTIMILPNYFFPLLALSCRSRR